MGNKQKIVRKHLFVFFFIIFTLNLQIQRLPCDLLVHSQDIVCDSLKVATLHYLWLPRTS